MRLEYNKMVQRSQFVHGVFECNATVHEASIHCHSQIVLLTVHVTGAIAVHTKLRLHTLAQVVHTLVGCAHAGEYQLLRE